MKKQEEKGMEIKKTKHNVPERARTMRQHINWRKKMK